MAIKTVATAHGELRLSYALQGENKGPKVLFLHGWGADRRLMAHAFSSHCPHWHSLYLDLPGFGGSQEPAKALGSEQYSAIVRVFLAACEFEPDVIIGHSFGGKIATRLDPPLLVLLSSAGIPKPKSVGVRLKIALAKLLRPLKSKQIRRILMTQDAHGQSEVMYGTLKKVVDEDYRPIFKTRQKPCWIFWGEADRATPLFCGEQLHQLIEQSHWVPLPGDHFFFTHHAATIVRRIDTALESL